MTTHGLGVSVRRLSLAWTFFCAANSFGTSPPAPVLCAEETTGAFDLTEHLRIFDPLRQIDRRAPLAIAMADDTTTTRLRFLAERLQHVDGRLKIVLHRHDTRIFMSWKALDRPHFTAQDFASSRRITFEWADWQDEHPEVIFFGAVTETAIEMLGESRVYREHLEQTLDLVTELCQRKLAEWRQGSDADKLDADVLAMVLSNAGNARWQLEHFFHLRNTWMAKIHFYRKQQSLRRELSRIDGVPTAPTLRHLADLELEIDLLPYRSPEQDAASARFESELRSKFSDFYSRHSHYRLSPALLRAAWMAVQPRLLESSLVAPQMLLAKNLFL